MRVVNIRQESVAAEMADDAMTEFLAPLGELGQKVGKQAMEIGMKAMDDHEEVGAPLWITCVLPAIWCSPYFFAQMARIARERSKPQVTPSTKLATARLYFVRPLPETASLILSCRAGVAPLTEMPEESF